MQLRGEEMTCRLGNEIAYNSGEEVPYFTIRGEGGLKYCTWENIQ
jgi:hypothetical protein